MPDRETGLPRPPHAPLFMGSRRRPDQDPSRDTRPSATPQAPDGQGPVLAWYRSSRRGAVIPAVLGVVVIVDDGSSGGCRKAPNENCYPSEPSRLSGASLPDDESVSSTA
jgi:hypothetical protein